MLNSFTETSDEDLSTMRDFTILNKQEKYLAELYTKDHSKKFYFNTENEYEYYSLLIDISSPKGTDIRITYRNRVPQYIPCKHFPNTMKSDHTYYTYYKLEQLNQSFIKKKYIFCRIEVLKEYNMKIILPLEDQDDKYCLLPEIEFMNILNKYNYVCNYENENIYCSEFMYTQLPCKFPRYAICEFDMKRHNYYYIASITSLQLINIYNTYLPYLRLAFMKHPTIIYDIKRLIFDKLDITNTDNILRILSYKGMNDIKRLIPPLIEEVMLYK